MEKSFEQRVAEARSAVPAIDPEEAHARLQRNPGTLFIDPRNEQDIRKSTGSIPGSISVPLDQLAELSDGELPTALKSRAQPIITACQGGPMGAIAAHLLKLRGFKNVAFVEGGTQGWLDAGFETVH